MGRIYRARERSTGRPVALKQLSLETLEQALPAERAEYRARFEREAWITARLVHPGIVPVYEIGELRGVPFIAMELVEGESLDWLMRRASCFEERLALVGKVADVAEAIAYAHDNGIIHRDLTPANILCSSDGATVVIDWGLAKAVDEDLEDSGVAAGVVARVGTQRLTIDGVVYGTPQYMSPEQGRGEMLDRRTDVYALGAILYRLIGGRPAYEPRPGCGNPAIDVVVQASEGPPPPLGEVEPRVPVDLLAIVERAISHDPLDRYSDASEFVEDLRRALGMPELPRPESACSRGGRRGDRRKRWYSGLVGLFR